MLVTPSKTRGRPSSLKCPYDLSRMDVEWLKALNKSRQNKALMELEESMLEKAISHIENKVISSFPYRFPLLDLLLVT